MNLKYHFYSIYLYCFQLFNFAIMLPIFQYYILCRPLERYRLPQFMIFGSNHSIVIGKRRVFDITKLSTLKTMLHQFSEFQSIVVWCQSWKQPKLKTTYAQSNLFLVFNVIKNNGNALCNTRICTVKSSQTNLTAKLVIIMLYKCTS